MSSPKRVSVDADALQEFIDTANENRQCVDGEFNVSRNEDRDSAQTFAEMVRKLDRRPI